MRDTGVLEISDGVCHLNPTAGDLNNLTFPDSIDSVITSRIDLLPPQQQLTLNPPTSVYLGLCLLAPSDPRFVSTWPWQGWRSRIHQPQGALIFPGSLCSCGQIDYNGAALARPPRFSRDTARA